MAKAKKVKVVSEIEAAVDELLRIEPEALAAAKDLIAREAKAKDAIKKLTINTRPTAASGTLGTVAIDWIDQSRLDTRLIHQTMNQLWIEEHSSTSVVAKIRRI